MKAMILAAGEGRRLRPLTLETPKPLVEVGGALLLQRHLVALEAAGFREVVINVSWLADKIEAFLRDTYQGAIKVRVMREDTLLETGGGVLNAMPYLRDDDKPFLVINSDVLTDFDFSRLPQSINGLAHLFLVDNPEHHPNGDFFLDQQGRVSSEIAQKSEHFISETVRYTFSGISLLSPKLFSGMRVEKFGLAPLFHSQAAQGKVSGEKLAGSWFDVGSIERLEKANHWIVSGSPTLVDNK